MTRLLRYAAVGAVATAAHYAVLVLLAEWGGWPAWLAAGAGAVVGAQLAYAGNRRLTFAHRGAVRQSWPRFQLTALAGALFSMGVVAAAQRLGWHYLAGQAPPPVVAGRRTYAVNRRWTFPARPDRG